MYKPITNKLYASVEPALFLILSYSYRGCHSGEHCRSENTVDTPHKRKFQVLFLEKYSTFPLSCDYLINIVL